jgi:hypothetical protein
MMREHPQRFIRPPNLYIMKLKTYFFGLSALCLFASCKKELSLEQARPPAIKPTPTQEEQFKKLATSAPFQLRGCYSDRPVDYVDNDGQDREETDLWPYVSPYLKDDINRFFSDNTNVTIEQKELKIPGNNNPVIEREYQIGTDSLGVYMNFLDNEYKPLQYRLHELGDTYFVLAAPWKNGVTLFSRFELVSEN